MYTLLDMSSMWLQLGEPQENGDKIVLGEL